jgi:tetratricopeptide (TPR) repeat protein
MHAELARLVTELPHDADLTLHVGVNSGHGIARILGSEARMDYAVLGDSVILAQRLESAAPPGETYLSETTARLTEGKFELEPVGELTLKGKAEPVWAWRLVGEAAAEPLRGSATLVGRDRELSELGATLQRVAEAEGGVLAVTGEPGVGKSHLVEAAHEHARELGLRWLSARCISYGEGLAYWPYAALLRGRDDAEGSPFFAKLLGLDGGAEVEALQPEAFRRGLHDSFAAWLERLGNEQPTLLVLEDVHWADASSLALTRELALVARGKPVGLVLTGRPEARTRIDELTEGIAASQLALGPLDPDAITALAASLLEGAPPAELVRVVVERTGGNPFFVKELLRAVRDSQGLVREAGRWQMRQGWNAEELPPTIEGVLAARIDLLPRSSATTLATASVIGRRVPEALLRAVAGDEGLTESLGDLVSAGFLERRRDELAFHHALVQDVAYSRLLRRHRRDLHRRVAEVAEGLYGAGDDAVDLLARHLYLGEAGEKAVAYLVRAGERAKRLFANEEAILHFRRASELSPDDPELRLTLAELDELVGSYDEALRLYEGVRDSTGDIRAWRGLAATRRKQGAYEDALQIVNDALASPALRDADLVPLWIENSWTLAVSGRYDQAIDVLLAGLAAVGRREDELVGRLLLELAVSEMFTGRLADALEHGACARQILEDHDDTVGLAKAMRVLGGVYDELERWDEAAATLRTGVELAERVGSVEELGGCLINLGIVEQKRGALEAAIECDRRAIDEFERVGHGSGRTIGYANLAEKLLVKGDYDAARSTAEHALELARSINLSYTIADLTKTIAAIELGQGESATAASRAEEAAELFVEVGALPAAGEALDLATEAWERAGEKERAAATSDRARSFAAPA